MKVYAIFANDNTKGTTHTIFSQAVAEFQRQGHVVDQLFLYEREKEIPFFQHNQEYMESHPFYLENKERFLRADTLLIVFPMFWYSVPAILKAWLDMINAWAYEYKQGLHATPKHSIKNVVILYAAMQSKQHLEETLHNPVEQQLLETFKFIGIPDVETHLIDKVNQLDTKKLSDHLEIIKILCKNCS